MAKQECIPLLKALADQTRWNLVRELLKGPRTVGELTTRVGAPQYNVSKHLRILRNAGIVEQRRCSKMVECSVAEHFRKRMAGNKSALDFGCCTFRFDKSPKKAPG